MQADLHTLKISPRDLVSKFFGDRNLEEDAIQDAVLEMMRRGWLPSFVPRESEWDRNAVFLPQRSSLAAIVRYLDGSGCGVVPRGLIESRTQFPVACIGSGLVLSDMGIAVMQIDGNNVFIRATTPGLALMVHSARIHPLEAMPMEQLINVTVGKDVPRSQWNDDLRLQVAMRFAELEVDVPGVVDGKSESDVQPRWQFTQRPSPTAQAGTDTPPF